MADRQWRRTYLRQAGAVTLTTLFGAAVYGETHHIVHSGPDCILTAAVRIVCDSLTERNRLPEHGPENLTSVTIVSSFTSSS